MINQTHLVLDQSRHVHLVKPRPVLINDFVWPQQLNFNITWHSSTWLSPIILHTQKTSNVYKFSTANNFTFVRSKEPVNFWSYLRAEVGSYKQRDVDSDRHFTRLWRNRTTHGGHQYTYPFHTSHNAQRQADPEFIHIIQSWKIFEIHLMNWFEK